MKLYNFTRLIKKYKCNFTVVTQTGGTYEGGIYVPENKTETEMIGAIVPLGENKIYQSGGSYTTQDRNLYMFKQIPKPLLSGKVIYKGNIYSIEENTDYSEYCDAFIYTLRRVSALD